MTKELCILHANCQGEPLLERLNRCPEFAARFDTRIYTNYTREPIPGEALAACSLFLYQYLEPGWKELASATLLDRLPSSAASLCVPNMFFKGYWPLWDGRKGFDYRCVLLDEIVDLGLPPEETVLLFLRQDVAAKFDLLALAAKSIETERQREAHTPVKYVDLMLSRYRDERLFNTVNHPCRLLMDHAAAGVLRELGFEPPDPAAPDAPGEPFPEFEQPIDPRIAAFFGWDFADKDTQYNIYGRKMGFTRYVANYVMARKAGISDFIGFLQGAYSAI